MGALASRAQSLAVHLALGRVNQRMRGQDGRELPGEGPAGTQQQAGACDFLASGSPVCDGTRQGLARQLVCGLEAAAHQRLRLRVRELLGGVVGLARKAAVAQAEPPSVDDEGSRG